jgi:nicotinamidase-related amidase
MANGTTHTALLVMDVQRGIVGRFTGASVFLARLAGAIEGARGAGILIEKVFPRQADVVSVDEWVSSLSGG